MKAPDSGAGAGSSGSSRSTISFTRAEPESVLDGMTSFHIHSFIHSQLRHVPKRLN